MKYKKLIRLAAVAGLVMASIAGSVAPAQAIKFPSLSGGDPQVRPGSNLISAIQGLFCSMGGAC